MDDLEWFRRNRLFRFLLGAKLTKQKLTHARCPFRSSYQLENGDYGEKVVETKQIKCSSILPESELTIRLSSQSRFAKRNRAKRETRPINRAKNS